MIARGELSYGQKVTLQSLAEKVGMSVIPVRDALKQLSYDRLLERAGRSYYRVLSLSKERIIEFSVLREALETQAARMCAEQITDEQVHELIQQADKLDRTVKAGLLSDSVHLEEELHLSIARIAGCDLLTEELERVQLVYATFPVEETEMVSSHKELVKTLASRDPDRAEEVMRRHVRARRRKIIRSVKQVMLNSEEYSR
jgi:DNA-binding GntR family transcriptional regulator